MLKISKLKQTHPEGVWAPWMGAKLKIAKSGRAAHVAIQDEVFAPYRHLIANDKLDHEKKRELMAEVAAKALLVGWDENLVDDEENPIEYSWETAAQFLIEVPELLEFVTQYSLNHANFRAETVADTAKKSSGSSSKGETGKRKTEKKN